MDKQQKSHKRDQLPSTDFSFRALDQESLNQLHAVLAKLDEGRGTLTRLSDLMGSAVGNVMQIGGEGLAFFPSLESKIHKIAETALKTAYQIAILGVEKGGAQFPLPRGMREKMTQALVAVSGGVGGFGGLLSLAPDIGVTTLAIMYDIAHIAKENGEDLHSEEAQRACLEVFALRNFLSRHQKNQKENHASDKGFFADGREKIAHDYENEAKEIGFFAARSLMRGQPLMLLIAEVAGQYGIGLSRKFTAQMVPVAGALCGAAINAAFLSHYRAVAQAHFTMRRLERIHGAAVQEAAYAYHSQQNEARFGDI